LSHLRGENKNTNTRHNVRHKRRKRARWRGEKITNITIDIQYNQTIRDKERRLRVGGPSAPRETALRAGRGEVRVGARACEKTKGLRFIKKKMQGVSPHT
jgi:hypothetical protein